MRPVLLELEGFASYRQRAIVDFRDTDFFVLVGPTGSGKSTVIDAMIFALYGTVPRWGERSAVAPALAPTVSRGTVRLIFDAGGQRYVAARDVRRSKSGVNVKEARLERFADSDAEGDVEDETTPMAVGRDVSTAVSELLGLTFEQFTKSVALPQGEFAQFLHATGAERQAILKSLLGYRIYDDIMRKAGSQATNEESRTKVLEEQLTDYANATSESVNEAQAVLDGLLALQKRVTEVAIPALATSIGQARDARSRAEQLTVEQAALAEVRVPPNVAELDAETVTRTEALEAARAESTRLEERDTSAREALQLATPRHELEQTIDNWRALAQIGAELPDLTVRASSTAAELDAATTARSDADAAVDLARAASDEAGKLAEQRGRELTEVTTRVEAVQHLRAPDELDELGIRQRESNQTLVEAKSALESAQGAQTETSTALAAQPDTHALVAASSALTDIRDALVEDRAGAAKRKELNTKAAKARRKAAEAAEAVVAAERAVREAEHADLAVTLRTGLAVGDDCPVCGRTVKTTPSLDDLAHVDGARDQLEIARNSSQEAEQKAAQIESACMRSATVRDERLLRCESARLKLVSHVEALGLDLNALATPIDSDADADRLESLREDAESLLASVREKQEVRANAEKQRRIADSAVEVAQRALRAAESAVESVRTEASRAQSALRVARDTVSSLDPPSIDDDDVSSAWDTLLSWAAGQSFDLIASQSAAEAASEESTRLAAERAAELTRAMDTATLAGEAVVTAAAAKSEADTLLSNAADRKSKLTKQLDVAPDLESALKRLEEVISLQTRSDELSTKLTAARAVVDTADKALADNQVASSASWQELRNLRDPLAGYGAPPLTESSLSEAWAQLASWAGAETVARVAKIEAERALAGDADERVTAARASLVAELDASNVAFADESSVEDLLTAAPVSVAAAAATASADRDRARERVRESSELRAKFATAQENAAVARKLAQLMHANQFQQWLIASALDTLLEEASVILMEVSGGQFELRRKEGDLEVVDHNDADMPRPVKTLSGGETFQASLALALALSSQVTALSASGGMTLESILLDEGFGTLDETTLDIVASTLENLASTGSRLVGVITHVAGLAERIPVRFSVHRDTLGSHIKREMI